MKSFKEMYKELFDWKGLNEAPASLRPVVFTFGRFNPMTKGHGEAIDFVVKTAKKKSGIGMILASHSQDAKKNPLDFKTKVKFLKKFFPKAEFITDPSLKTAFQVMDMLVAKGHKDITFVVGGDRVAEFKRQMAPYVNHKDPKKSWDLDKFEVLNSGERVAGVSGTDMRSYVSDDKFDDFKKNLPKGVSDRDAKAVFDAVKKGMGL